jgi:AGZA family xanthine/uracil permease-like MFS transporter
MEKFFKLGLRGTDKKTEIIAGLTTFMTMAYVLAVQPAAICGGEAYITDVNGVVITKSAIMITCALVSGLITLLMAFYTNFPFALSTGMGSNFILGALIQSQALSFGAAMAITLISGIIFVLLTVFGLRDLIVRVIPKNIKIAISASIGFFIAYLGLKTALPSAISPILPCCWPSAVCCSSSCSTP